MLSKWLLEHPLEPVQVDCVTSVMLKILDGKCKMPATEKMIMQALYDITKNLQGRNLGEDIHQLIELGRCQSDDESIRLQIYEKRVLAETMISRPIMKAFKTMIRDRNLLQVNISLKVDNKL